MSFSTASVQIGAPTRKSDYDRLLQNDVAIASGSFTFYGNKIHVGTQLFKAKTTFTATAVFSKPVRLNNTDNTIGMLTIDSAALAANQYQTLAHGLSVKPNRIQYSLLCITAEYGYVAGETIETWPNYYTGIGASYYWTLSSDVTNFYIATSPDPFVIRRKNAPIGGGVNITFANWKIRIRYGL